MKQWKVYRRKWIQLAENLYLAEMVPVMTLNARSGPEALRIAKQKGELHPIVGPIDV